MEGLVFRPMLHTDLPGVLAIEGRAHSHPWSRTIFTEGLDTYECWVLQQQEQLVGYAVLQIILDEAHLLNLTIEPNRQGAGLGRYFLLWLLVRMHSLGAGQCFLELRASNLAAYHLYQRAGFNEIGCRTGYYPAPGGREDALVMACVLLEEHATLK